MTEIVLKRRCSRCPRVEEESISLEQAANLSKKNLSGPKSLVVRMNGDTVLEFDKLCATCEEIVGNYLSHIGKKLQHASSLRKHKDDVEIEIEA